MSKRTKWKARGKQWPGTGPCANHAQVRSPNRKKLARLLRRTRDYDLLKADNKHESKVQMRIDGGGYHRPGSMK